jgi:hypothetical protein
MYKCIIITILLYVDNLHYTLQNAYLILKGSNPIICSLHYNFF